MKRVGILVLLVSVLLYGCNQEVKEEEETDSNKNQFIEIVTQDGDCVGIIDDSKKIKDFIEHLDMDSWEYNTYFSEDAKLLYSYVTYEIVDDEFFLKGQDPYVVKSTMDLYKQGQEYYVVIDETTNKISEDIGIYISEPEKIGLNTSKSAQIFLDEWGHQIKDIINEDNTLDDEEESEVYSKEDVASVSKEQKIEICDGEDEVVFSTSDISVITDILNAAQTSNWQEIDQWPDEAKKICTIKKYSLKRKQIEKELVADYIDTIYFYGDEYYIEHRMSGVEGKLDDYVKYYKVSDEIVDYIISYLN